MHLFTRLGKLKKSIRRKLKWLSLVAVLLFLAFLNQHVWDDRDQVEEQAVFSNQVGHTLEEIPKLNDDESMDVYVVRRFLCGEELIYKGHLKSDEIEHFSKQERTLSFGWIEGKRLYFVEEVDDLSDECKETAYFGMDREGNLSLFNGVPKKKRIIRTFFSTRHRTPRK